MRLKQAMREAAGIGGEPAALAIEPAQQGTTESVQTETVEAKAKLQHVDGALTDGGDVDALARTVSEKMSFHSDDGNKKKGVDFIKKLYFALAGDGNDKQSVRHKRQLKIVGPSNNGKTCLAQWMARMWVASATDRGEQGGWIETYVTMETMDAHLWSARESMMRFVRWSPANK